MKHVLAYLKKYNDLGIMFRASRRKGVKLEVYVDASHLTCPDTSRSQTGVLVLLNGMTVAWLSKRQSKVTLSTCESEYGALTSGCKEVIHYRRLLEELGFSQEEPTVVYCDSQSAISTANTPEQMQRTRYFKAESRFVQECIDDGLIQI